MGGSYTHVTSDEDGRLLISQQVQSMLECHSRDVYEAVEQMYGMIWWLASALEGESSLDRTAAQFVEAARHNYKNGLDASPGVGGRLPQEPDDEG